MRLFQASGRKSCAFAPIFALAALVILSPPLASEDRDQGIDVYILLDRSKSMAEEGKFARAREWLTDSLVKPLLLPGDSVCLITFYGKADVVWENTLKSETGKKSLVNALSGLKPTGRWTDIGNALDILKAKIEKRADLERKVYVLLVSDERQEAPPGSRYFSKDGKFSHSYLTFTRRESHGGWNVVTLGVGIDETVARDAKEIASFLTEIPAGRNDGLPGGPADAAAAGGTGPGKDGTSAVGPKTPGKAAGGMSPFATAPSWAANMGIPAGIGWLLSFALALLALLLSAVLVIFAAKRLKSRKRDEADASAAPADATRAAGAGKAAD